MISELSLGPFFPLPQFLLLQRSRSRSVRCAITPSRCCGLYRNQTLKSTTTSSSTGEWTTRGRRALGRSIRGWWWRGLKRWSTHLQVERRRLWVLYLSTPCNTDTDVESQPSGVEFCFCFFPFILWCLFCVTLAFVCVFVQAFALTHATWRFGWRRVIKL